MRNKNDAAHEIAIIFMQNQDIKDKTPNELSKIYLDAYLTVKEELASEEKNGHEQNFKLYD